MCPIRSLRMRDYDREQGIYSFSGSQAELIRLRRKLKLKTDYMMNLSHDMRVPLCGVMGYMDLALRSDDPDRIHDFLRKAQVSGEIMMKLINDTLDYNRIGTNAFELKQEIVSASVLFRQVVISVLPSMEEKHIDFHTVLPEGPDVWICADMVRVQEIFLNLLSNAARYTPDGGTVSFRVSSSLPDDAHIQYHVYTADSGSGISAKFLPRIFEPFTQENDTSSPDQGSGLGLAIAQKLVELMKGKISVESSPASGTAFTVVLDFKKAPAPKTAVLPAGKADLKELSGIRVLLCEDNETNTEIVKEYLAEAGADVTCTHSGRRAAEAFERSDPGYYQVILMDIRMADLGGYAASRRIRELARPDAARVVILALTADVCAEDVKKCLEAGMNGHIPKPADRTRLIREILRSRK